MFHLWFEYPTYILHSVLVYMALNSFNLLFKVALLHRLNRNKNIKSFTGTTTTKYHEDKMGLTNIWSQCTCKLTMANNFHNLI